MSENKAMGLQITVLAHWFIQNPPELEKFISESQARIERYQALVEELLELARDRGKLVNDVLELLDKAQKRANDAEQKSVDLKDQVKELRAELGKRKADAVELEEKVNELLESGEGKLDYEMIHTFGKEMAQQGEDLAKWAEGRGNSGAPFTPQQD